VKKQPLVLSCIAGWIVCMQLLDMYIVVLPALHGTGVHLSILDFLPLIGIGGTLGFSRHDDATRLRCRPLDPGSADGPGGP